MQAFLSVLYILIDHSFILFYSCQLPTLADLKISFTLLLNHNSELDSEIFIMFILKCLFSTNTRITLKQFAYT